MMTILGTRAASATGPPSETVPAAPDTVFGLASTLDQLGYLYTSVATIVAIGVVLRNVSRYDHVTVTVPTVSESS